MNLININKNELIRGGGDGGGSLNFFFFNVPLKMANQEVIDGSGEAEEELGKQGYHVKLTCLFQQS